LFLEGHYFQTILGLLLWVLLIYEAGLAIGSSVICNLSVIELHGWISQGAMFGSSARNPLSPYAVRPGL
jgi:hypothetical protein